jgi:phage-related protein
VEGAKGVINTVKDVAGGIVNTVTDFFGIASPSKLFKEYGKQLDAGLALGITSNSGMVDDAIGGLNTTVDGTYNTSAAGRSLPQTGSRPLTVVLELDKTQLGRAVYNLNSAETQRVGTKLAGGYV